jgi:4-aminobutyrate aminotransferase-like enzyme/Ser/Thr protein kinase RdoA (MazF antagonist)
MIRTQERPDISPEAAGRLVRDGFALDGSLTALPGERDRNLLLETPEGNRFVVKVTSPEEPEEQLRFETQLLKELGEDGGLPIPQPIPSASGDLVLRTDAEDGSRWRVRVLEHLPGRVLAEVRPKTQGLLEELGRQIADLEHRLGTITLEPPERSGFIWALAEAGTVMEQGVGLHEDPARRALIEACLAGFVDAQPTASSLPRQLVHGDLNDHNILVGGGPQSNRRVTGILDFGDSHVAPAVFDLAIAAAYLCLDAADPLAAATHVVRGYHARRPLTEPELDILFPLIRARLGASVTISASRQQSSSELDEYLLISEAPAWRALEAMGDIHPRLARGFFRDACGLPACPRSALLVDWIREQTPAPVMHIPVGPETAVLDHSVGSPDLTGRDTEDTAHFARRVFDQIEREGARVGLGRYLEPRGFYLTEAFAGRPSGQPERRTIHLGIDVYDRAGSPVRAPLDATVRWVQDNAGRLDYGPTVTLEHETPHGPFWTLYGHLERASVADLEEGSRIAAGTTFARVGPYPENGDWPPHLHLQVITDSLGYEGDFPGVAAPRETEVWSSFCPDPDELLRLSMPTTYRPTEGLRARRVQVLGPNLSLSYPDAIHVVRGRGAYLFDSQGREYLDCVNNVAHVGHEHPRVVSAGQRQMAVLNTNTRYLHEAVIEYAERLGALLPDPLSVCYLVNSGSEANELALRMARTVTGGEGVVVVEGGYHGNTQGLIDVSHYKFDRKGGQGPPAWVRAAAMPEDYRGRYLRSDPERAQKYAEHVSEALDRLQNDDFQPAAFLSEPMLSCGGQVELPEGYLQAAYAFVRNAGALCIADEVQIGFGRMGSHLWGFQTQDVIPDIVTLGKPIGNGHPLGAVVTTPEIAARFANGMEFFSTFGGNPVSARIGLAVLDVMETEGLQQHVAEVGATFKADLSSLMDRHGVVGDVRGRGLFLGIELVSDREVRIPDPDAARYVVNRMKEQGILLSADGPDDNVIKIKPPLPFSGGDALRVVETLDSVLLEDAVRRAP